MSLIYEGLAVVAMTLGPCCNNDATCRHRVTCVEVEEVKCTPVTSWNDVEIVPSPTFGGDVEVVGYLPEGVGEVRVCVPGPQYWCECVDKTGEPEIWSPKRQDGEEKL